MLILLLGPPGAGKTSLGQRLAQRLNYKWVDVDDHVLEPEWRCSVSEKLCQLGDQLFIEEEGDYAPPTNPSGLTRMKHIKISSVRVWIGQSNSTEPRTFPGTRLLTSITNLN